jgi:hypothetical protein
MRLSHPVLATVLQRSYRSQPLWMRSIGAVYSLGMLAGTLFFTLELHRQNLLDGVFDEDEPALYVMLYAPVALIQLAMVLTMVAQVVAVGLTRPGASSDVQRQTWEMTKVTSHGAELVVRARWIALLYRARLVLAFFVGVRLVFAVQIVAQIAADQGMVRAALAEGSPALPPGLDLALLGVLVLVLVALPLVTFAMIAALSLWLETVFSVRFFLQVVQVVLIVVTGTAMFVLLVIGWTALETHEGTLWPGGGWQWWGVFGMAVTGDLGLRLMNLDRLLALVNRVDGGVWLALPLLAVLAAEVWLTRCALHWAAVRAGRAGKM